NFFWGLAGLLAWALFPLRSKRFSIASWIATLGVAVVIGYFGQKTVAEFQRYVGGLNPYWMSGRSPRGVDPRPARTRSGHVGRNKLSGAIVIRVEARDGLQVPKLLREATYRSYRAATWNSGNGQRGEFETINAENTNSTLWVLVPGKETSARVNIACYLPGG